MGVEWLEIGFQIRKFVIFSIKTCHRSVWNHPFLVGLVFFVILVYKLFPFMFSLLVSVSPVLVCTAVLLGTLLSFGQPNIPEIETEEKTTHEIVSLKTGASRDAIVVERDENYVLERYTGNKGYVVGKSIEEASMTANDVSEVDKGDSLVDGPPQLEQSSQEIEFQKQVIKDGEKELNDSIFDQKSGINEVHLGDGEIVENEYLPIQRVDENLEIKNSKSEGDRIDSQRTAYFDPLAGSPWKHMEDGEDDDDDASDGSDRAESSSPDASMADIIPMLDELHPLLDEDAPQPAQMSHDGSDAASECSLKSSDGGDESDENTDNQEELVIGDDDNDDEDDEEEEIQGDKEDGTKSAITWTEDDQKNLMDLGTSELERNQRLENLIARRRARKSMRMVAERNLIDLEGADLPFGIAHISTTRHNPFDLPDDFSGMGLPPIPGSAPSILLPRRNPFDIPYDSSEEKPDLLGDSFQQEFIPFQPKEPFFRRHESFNVGPSFFATSRQEKQDIKLRPYFVPERIVSEGTGYSPFQRQSSELSDSKVSSIPETESIGSAGDRDDKNLIEEDFSVKAELISNIEHTSEHVGHGSQSSEDVDSVDLGQVENIDLDLDEIEIKIGDQEDHHGMEASLSESESVAFPLEHSSYEIDNTEPVEQSRSSSSSLSEVIDKVINEKEGEGLSSLEPIERNIFQTSGISKRPSLERSDVSITSGLSGDEQHKEPVYDSSPSAVKKSLSCSSTSSDLHVEISEMGSPPVLVKRTISFTLRESELSNRNLKKDTPGDEEMLADSSQLLAVDEIEVGSSGVTETCGPEAMKFGFSEVNLKSGSANHMMMPESVVKYASVDSKSPSETPVEEILVFQNGSHQHTWGQVPLLSFEGNIHGAVSQDVMEKVEFKSSENQCLDPTKEEQHSLVVVDHPDISFETEPQEVHLIDKEVAHQFVQDKIHSSKSDVDYYAGTCKEADEKLVSTHHPCVSEEKYVLQSEKELPSPDKSVDESSENLELLVESIEEVGQTTNLNMSEIQEHNDKVALDIYSLSRTESTSILSDDSETKEPTTPADLKGIILGGIENDDSNQVLEHCNFPMDAIHPLVDVQNIIENSDDVKEIDEGLLLELDTIGDFSLRDLRSNFSEIQDHLVSDGESFLAQCDLDPNSSGAVEGNPIKVDEGEGIVSKENLRISRIEEVDKNEERRKGALEFQISGISSIEHVDPSIRKYGSEEVENPPIDLNSIKDERPLKKSVVLAKNSLVKLYTNAEELDSGMPVVEAQELKDTESILKAEPMLGKTEIGLAESGLPHQGQIEEERDFGMPVLEALSLDDVNSTFKQITEVVEKPIVIDSLHDELILEENMAGSSESRVMHDGSNWRGTELELPVLEARSMEDIDLDFKKLQEGFVESHNLHGSDVDRSAVAECKDPAEMLSELHAVETRSPKDINVSLMQVSESNLDKLSKLDSEDGLEALEAIDEGFSKDVESSIQESSLRETSSGAPEKSDHEGKTSEELSSS